MIDKLKQSKCGLVLAGGGGKGAYQVGVYKALAEMGLDKQIVAMSGSSVGALNMVLFSMDDIEMAEYVWKNISYNQFLKIEREMMFDGVEGFVSREGLLNIIDNYINREKLLNDTRPMYATLSRQVGEASNNSVSEYIKINQCPYEELKQVLLASSALPIVYEAVKIGDNIYRDGGITDNLPIKPLYEEGIRDFILMLLSPNTKIPYEKYPDANFYEFRPTRDLGDIISGALDFSSKGAFVRMELGYADAIRYMKYYGNPEFNTPQFKVMMMEAADKEYGQICNKYKVEEVERRVNTNVSNVKSYFDKYDIEI